MPILHKSISTFLDQEEGNLLHCDIYNLFHITFNFVQKIKLISSSSRFVQFSEICRVHFLPEKQFKTTKVLNNKTTMGTCFEYQLDSLDISCIDYVFVLWLKTTKMIY